MPYKRQSIYMIMLISQPVYNTAAQFLRLHSFFRLGNSEELSHVLCKSSADISNARWGLAQNRKWAYLSLYAICLYDSNGFTHAFMVQKFKKLCSIHYVMHVGGINSKWQLNRKYLCLWTAIFNFWLPLASHNIENNIVEFLDLETLKTWVYSRWNCAATYYIHAEIYKYFRSVLGTWINMSSQTYQRI